DLVIVEAVAVVAAEVTDTVEEYVVTRSESPDREIVPLSAALTGSNTYPWHITNGVCESTILLIMQNKVRDHSHRLRCVHQVLGKFSHRHNRRQLGRHIDCVRVLKTHSGAIRILEAVIQAGAVQQLAKRNFGRVQPLDTRSVECGKLIRRNRNLNRDPALLPVRLE